MRWLADECVDAALVGRLRAAGHDTSYVAEGGAGTLDTGVLRRAHDERRLLLTEDKDFGDLVFRRRMPVPGLVLLRVDPERRSVKWTRLETAIALFGAALFGRYLVVEEARFRSRPLLISIV